MTWLRIECEMTSIERTAYPRFKRLITARELDLFFSPGLEGTVGRRAHGVVSARGLRYFAHDPGRPKDCAWLNESLEHHLLKPELATAIRAAGWHAELEVRAPGGSWRADVLASAHDGSRRVAFEAQLSPITDDDITARTSRYRADGIDVCWVSTGRWPPWMETVP